MRIVETETHILIFFILMLNMAVGLYLYRGITDLPSLRWLVAMALDSSKL